MFRKIFLTIIIVSVAFALVYGRQIYHYSESPSFCNSCHVMNYQYENFIHNGAHQNRRCIECHLPNDNIFNHLLWKGIDGTKDVVYFYGGLYPDNIEISDHGNKVVNQNCISCHSEMVSRIDMGSRSCTDCHRRHKHKYTGVF